jgi:hypothetical protein
MRRSNYLGSIRMSTYRYAQSRGLVECHCIGGAYGVVGECRAKSNEAGTLVVVAENSGGELQEGPPISPVSTIVADEFAKASQCLCRYQGVADRHSFRSQLSGFPERGRATSAVLGVLRDDRVDAGEPLDCSARPGVGRTTIPPRPGEPSLARLSMTAVLRVIR